MHPWGITLDAGDSVRQSGGANRSEKRILTQLARALFPRLRRENPHWDYADLRDNLDLPDTDSLRECAREAGFALPGPLSRDEENTILRTLRRGVFGPEDVARETGLPLVFVKAFLDEIGVPFGAGGWGMFPWPCKVGGRKRVSMPEPRRVSAKGQLSFRGHTYGLGTRYAGAIAWVAEHDGKVIARFSGARHPDKPTLTLYKTG